MISFDFNTYNDMNIVINQEKKHEIIDQLKHDYMAGFFHHVISSQEIKRIISVAKEIKKSSDVFIVIGIGGSFMGSFAISEIFKNYFNTPSTEVIYLGTNLSTNYLQQVLDYIKDKDVSINVISKSGTTLEISLIYKLIKNELLKKYSDEELRKRIIITTNREKGKLLEEANQYHYTLFEIPTDIGGRYSLITAAHLLPLAVLDMDIESLVQGYKRGLDFLDDAYLYANYRVNLFKKGKFIENFSVYEDNLYYYTEWIKQLFGESEGKDNLGIFPVSTVNTRDLHSLGQFIQNGNNIIFETVIKVLKIPDIKIGDISLNKINHLVVDSVCTAHQTGNTPSNIITISELSIENIGMLSAFFMLSAAFSAYLFEVDPFTQPGVEEYKSEIRKRVDINKI